MGGWPKASRVGVTTTEAVPVAPPPRPPLPAMLRIASARPTLPTRGYGMSRFDSGGAHSSRLLSRIPRQRVLRFCWNHCRNSQEFSSQQLDCLAFLDHCSTIRPVQRRCESVQLSSPTERRLSTCHGYKKCVNPLAPCGEGRPSGGRCVASSEAEAGVGVQRARLPLWLNHTRLTFGRPSKRELCSSLTPQGDP